MFEQKYLVIQNLENFYTVQEKSDPNPDKNRLDIQHCFTGLCIKIST
jgi:hypothetical protein